MNMLRTFRHNLSWVFTFERRKTVDYMSILNRNHSYKKILMDSLVCYFHTFDYRYLKITSSTSVRVVSFKGVTLEGEMVPLFKTIRKVCARNVSVLLSEHHHSTDFSILKCIGIYLRFMEFENPVLSWRSWIIRKFWSFSEPKLIIRIIPMIHIISCCTKHLNISDLFYCLYLNITADKNYENDWIKQTENIRKNCYNTQKVTRYFHEITILVTTLFGNAIPLSNNDIFKLILSYLYLNTTLTLR